MNKKVFEVDLDGTLCITKNANYAESTPIKEHIDVINSLYDAGNTIKINTARGSATGIDWTQLTCKQLEEWGVRYTSLTVGRKNQYDYIIDDKSLNIMQQFNYIKLVKKYWGEEHWLFENKDFAVKEMVISAGKFIKAHYHEYKRELFYVTKGFGIIKTNDQSKLLFPGSFAYIESGVVHRVEAASEDLHVVEISNGFYAGDSRRVEACIK